jgi:hypothetical protein
LTYWIKTILLSLEYEITNDDADKIRPQMNISMDVNAGKLMVNFTV